MSVVGSKEDLGPPGPQIEGDEHVDSTLSSSHEQDSYESGPDQQPLAPANFRPFFTLVEDAESGEHYHPHVHYIFSDDDPDTLTSSVIDTLHPEIDNNHRLVLVDVGVDGRMIQATHSLSSDWQVTQTDIVPAPSWTASGAETTSDGGLMLKIEGATPWRPRKERQQEERHDAVKQLEVDIESYSDQLRHLQSVLAKSSVL